MYNTVQYVICCCFCLNRTALFLWSGVWSFWYPWLRDDGRSDAVSYTDHMYILDEVIRHC